MIKLVKSVGPFLLALTLLAIPLAGNRAPVAESMDPLRLAVACATPTECSFHAAEDPALVGADAQRSANDELGDADPVETVRPASSESPSSGTDGDREAYEAAVAAMIDAAAEAGYGLVQSDCKVKCNSDKDACPGLPARHTAPVTPFRISRLGTGDHQLCEAGDCLAHRHYTCFRGSDIVIRLFEAIADGDWSELATRIAEADHMTYNPDRHAIQGLDCAGDHLALHLPAPSGFVEFMDP